jgi:DNA-binding protein YbaB
MPVPGDAACADARITELTDDSTDALHTADDDVPDGTLKDSVAVSTTVVRGTDDADGDSVDDDERVFDGDSVSDNDGDILSDIVTVAGNDGETLSLTDPVTVSDNDGEMLSDIVTVAGNDGETLSLTDPVTVSDNDGEMLTDSVFESDACSCRPAFKISSDSRRVVCADERLYCMQKGIGTSFA